MFDGFIKPKSAKQLKHPCTNYMRDPERTLHVLYYSLSYLCRNELMDQGKSDHTRLEPPNYVDVVQTPSRGSFNSSAIWPLQPCALERPKDERTGTVPPLACLGLHVFVKQNHLTIELQN